MAASKPEGLAILALNAFDPQARSQVDRSTKLAA